jgi:hypothetical protein
VHDEPRRGKIDAGAEVVATEADQRDAQSGASDVSEFH